MRRLTLALTLLVPGVLGAQQLAAAPDPARQRARLQRELDPTTYAAIARVVDGAQARGLPQEPLLNKALQSVFFKKPSATIRSSVERLAGRLDSASRALAPASPADIEAGAEALGAGVPAQTLTSIRQLRPAAPVAVELGVLAQLVNSGVPIAKASEKIVELMRQGSRPAQIVALGDSVRSDVADGTKPIEAFDARARGILAGTIGGSSVAADGLNVETSLPGFSSDKNNTLNGPARNAPASAPKSATRKP